MDFESHADSFCLPFTNDTSEYVAFAEKGRVKTIILARMDEKLQSECKRRLSPETAAVFSKRTLTESHTFSNKSLV